jgi:formylglycine-generating enzyme required for sulfatase activity
MPLELVLRSAQRARRLSLVILDACRDNPFVAAMIRAGGTRAIGHGLARVEPVGNTLVAYAVKKGTTADDGEGRNSPYTTVLLEHLEKPGVEITMLLRQVRNAVVTAAGACEEPFVYGSLSREAFYLVPPSEPARPPAQEAEPQPAPAPAKPRGLDERALDLAFWKSIKHSDDRGDFEEYLAQYPDGAFAPVARRRKEELDEARVAVVTPRRPVPLPAGTTFRDCPECPEMVVVPAGTFMMGSPDNEAGRNGDEGPQHTVSIPEPFAIGRYEVTFAEWEACFAAGGCGHLPGDKGWGHGNRPVINVSWKDAREYVGWLSEKTGHTYRLPSEVEWEYTARAGTHTIYWWGAEVGRNNGNCNGCGSEWDNKQSAPVGSFAPNRFGLYDVLGNVWERVEDCYHVGYSGAPGDGSPWTSRSCRKHVLRGGSWASAPGDVRSATRGSAGAGARVKLIGFRVARTLF